jgi:Lrp/AsnC family leucine-responsive transcriptional regulator
MAAKRRSVNVDALDWKLLNELQRDARQSDTSLARKVGLSRPAVAERIARLEADGVIDSYAAHVVPARVGWTVDAFLHLRSRGGNYEDAIEAIVKMPEVVECHRVTGQSFVLVRIRATSNKHIQRLLFALTRFGDTETMIVLSSPLARRAVGPPP